jgi:hypothetical protein
VTTYQGSLRLLGEPVRADSLEPGQLIWHDQSFRTIADVSITTDEHWLVLTEEGDALYFIEDDLVMRGVQYVWGKDS